MDHSRTIFPRLQVKNKMVLGLGQILIKLISMIAHGHEDEAYAQYSNEFWPNDLNFTIRFMLHLLRALEKELVLGLGLSLGLNCMIVSLNN
jgi:hypothetical protein